MKKLLQLSLAAAVLILSGCTKTTTSSAVESNSPPSALQTAQMAVSVPASPQSDPALEKYIDVLEGIYFDRVLPDGQRLESYTEYFEESPNEFAVWDIDGDGEQELIVRYTNTYMAGMFGAVYGYDRNQGRLTTQLLEFPALSFFPNGTVEAGWSHNQGLAGRFWPCTLYRYDADSDTYFPVASVDAWDRDFFEIDFDGNPFPTEADPDEDNIVYYIHLYGQAEEPSPVSQREFNAWYQTLIGFDSSIHDYSSFSLDIPYLPLTEENILSISEE